MDKLSLNLLKLDLMSSVDDPEAFLNTYTKIIAYEIDSVNYNPKDIPIMYNRQCTYINDIRNIIKGILKIKFDNINVHRTETCNVIEFTQKSKIVMRFLLLDFNEQYYGILKKFFDNVTKKLVK